MRKLRHMTSFFAIPAAVATFLFAAHQIGGLQLREAVNPVSQFAAK